MYVNLYPEEFTGVELNADRSSPRVQLVLGEQYTVNPATLVGPDEQAMVRLWADYERHGTLPDHGAGSLDVPTVMRAAFDLMSAAKDDAREERRRLGLTNGRGH